MGPRHRPPPRAGVYGPLERSHPRELSLSVAFAMLAGARRVDRAFLHPSIHRGGRDRDHHEHRPPASRAASARRATESSISRIRAVPTRPTPRSTLRRSPATTASTRGDGPIDFSDPQCSQAWPSWEASRPCGIGIELALAIPVLAAWGGGRGAAIDRCVPHPGRSARAGRSRDALVEDALLEREVRREIAAWRRVRCPAPPPSTPLRVR